MTESRWIKQGRVFNWAHRGAGHEGPANTVYAMKRAVAAGADGLEVDLHRTLDGKIVVVHDDTVTDTTGFTGAEIDAAIAHMTWEQLQTLDAAHWWREGFISDHNPRTPHHAYPLRGHAEHDETLRIPLLSTLLETFPTTPINMDLKRAGYEGDVADLIRKYDAGERTIVASFGDAIRTFRGYAPEIATAASRPEILALLRKILLRQDPGTLPFVAAQIPKVTSALFKPFVRGCQRHKIAVHVWTVDNVTLMDKLIAMDIDGIMTNRSGVLAALLREKDALWSAPSGEND